MLKHLKELRIAAGLSQGELADRVHISRSAYTYYELGERTPGIEVVVALAAELGTSTDYLLGLTDSPRSSTAISEDEMKFIEAYRKLDSRGKKTVQNILLYEGICYSVPDEENREH